MERLKDSGERTQFETGAVRDMHEGKGRFDLLPMCVLLRLAKHYEKGAKKYGGHNGRNWELGIPCHSFVDSAFRHLVKYMDGYTDEDHLIAAIWNLCGLAWTEEKKPEMMDIPARLEAMKDKGIGLKELIAKVGNVIIKDESSSCSTPIPTKDNTCICCGAVIPEGSQVCPNCTTGNE